jgi:hypothetical protein
VVPISQRTRERAVPLSNSTVVFARATNAILRLIFSAAFAGYCGVQALMRPIMRVAR